MSHTQHDYNAMSKVELVKLIAKAMGVGVTAIRKDSKNSLVAHAITLFRKPAQQPATATATAKAGDSTPAEPKRHYRLTSNGGSTFLRRDQPRKPGDVACYRVVEGADKAFVVKSAHQLVIKLEEAARLLGKNVTAVPFAV